MLKNITLFCIVMVVAQHAYGSVEHQVSSEKEYISHTNTLDFYSVKYDNLMMLSDIENSDDIEINIGYDISAQRERSIKPL